MPEETALQKVIDVVEDFSCPYQTDAYQEAFRSWRRKKQNPYAFRFTKNPKETAFSESQSSAIQSPAQTEQRVLSRLGSLIGYAMICYLIIENILDKFVVLLMQFLHLHIEIVFSGESRLYGDETLVFWVALSIQFLKYLVPTLMLQAVLKLPVQVSIPLKIRKPNKLLSGFALVMLLSAGLGMLSAPMSADLEKYRLMAGTTNPGNYKIIIYILMTIFILPLITELLLHGCMFQILRQFGDLFAAVSTALLAAALTHNFFDALRIGLIHLTISYYLIHTGSFWSAACLRIVHEIYMFAIFYLETYDSIGSREWWIVLLLPCLLSAGAIVHFFLTKNKTAPPTDQNITYLNLREKAEAFFTAMPMVGFLICSILLLTITAMLT
ncbi:MAG: hypothetical protein IJ642_05460 [Oscillospiraceae bacterium]|nr:hypothetical protein [Oscillospiraceae bacterium]